jgi:hypothetical protein
MIRQNHRKERSCRGQIVPPRDVYVDDLAILIHRPVHIPPNTSHLDIGLVNEPAVTDTVATRPRGVDE